MAGLIKVFGGDSPPADRILENADPYGFREVEQRIQTMAHPGRIPLIYGLGARGVEVVNGFASGPGRMFDKVHMVACIPSPRNRDLFEQPVAPHFEYGEFPDPTRRISTVLVVMRLVAVDYFLLRNFCRYWLWKGIPVDIFGMTAEAETQEEFDRLVGEFALWRECRPRPDFYFLQSRHEANASWHLLKRLRLAANRKDEDVR